MMLKVASWNVNSLNVRLPHVLDWCRDYQPDLLGLQETKLTDDRFPQEQLLEAGYHTAFAGQKTYNGVAILSRVPPTDVVTDLPGLDDPQRRVLAATCGDLRLVNLYVPNGSEVGSEKYAYKLDWLERLAEYLEGERARHPNLVVMGDFNIAPTDADVHDPDAWAGKVLCSEPERAALQRLLDLGLADTFRLFEQPDGVYSWWDYRMNLFRRGMGLRIDLVLASTALAERCTRAAVDPEPRGWERPSDHAPALAEFDHTLTTGD
ncbi:MAG: exodeoxyribonuclease III [Pseudomonadota bacterium]